MTREEATAYFKRHLELYCVEGICRESEEMAIRVLEQQDVLDKIKKEIVDWQTDIHDNEYDANKFDFVFERILEIIDEHRVESEGEK